MGDRKETIDAPTASTTGSRDGSAVQQPERSPTTWTDIGGGLDRSEVFWISSVRPDGHPHVVPLIGVWVGDALHRTSGPDEHKARNLAMHPRSMITTGCNAMNDGLYVAIE